MEQDNTITDFQYRKECTGSSVTERSSNIQTAQVQFPTPCRKHCSRQITVFKRLEPVLLTSWSLGRRPNNEKSKWDFGEFLFLIIFFFISASISWIFAVVIAVLILLIVAILAVSIVMRNKGKTYLRKCLFVPSINATVLSYYMVVCYSCTYSKNRIRESQGVCRFS